jgi:pimeloyl-ACP methyl ester carboxylesterase
LPEITVTLVNTARCALLLSTSISLIGTDAQAQPTTRSAPIPPAAVAETSFTFTRDSVSLEGTLAVPRSATGRMPVVLMVAGSGATDRNANGPLISTNAYAMLAWGLAERGIASLRYDTRGLGKSAFQLGDITALTIDDYVMDVAAGVAALRSHPRFSEVILLGHSEGAGHVLMAANRGAAVAGVIMLSPQGRRLAEVLHDQFSLQTDSATVQRIDSAFARYLRGEPTPDVPPIAQPITLPMYRNFMRSMAAYDPPKEASRLTLPLLIIMGTTDIQVSTRDAELLTAAQPRATYVALENVNHVLKIMPSMSLADQRATYNDPTLPLAPTIVPAIADWIAKLPR